MSVKYIAFKQTNKAWRKLIPNKYLSVFQMQNQEEHLSEQTCPLLNEIELGRTSSGGNPIKGMLS
jgi:hypothetical protein